MAGFVLGTLEENQEGASYEDVVYDRNLKVRISNGQVLPIFDPGVPLSGELRAGMLCELVLVVAVPRLLRYQWECPPDALPGDWLGQVRNAAFRFAEPALLMRPDLKERAWLLLDTEIGRILMSSAEPNTKVGEGGYLRWQQGRLDLYAVLRADSP